jgi:Positive regulator of sigma(E), RseC/MucC.
MQSDLKRRPLFFYTRYDTGTISGIEPTGLWVTMHIQGENRSTCVGCKKCVPSQTPPKLFVKAKSPCIYSLHQNVVVKRTMPHTGWTAGFIFGVPLLSAFALLLVWNYISSQTIGSPLSIGATAAAMLIGLVAVFKGDAFVRNNFPAALSTIAAPDTSRHTHG